MKKLISIEDVLRRSWGTFLTEWRASIRFILPAMAIPIIGMIPFIFAAEEDIYMMPAAFLAFISVIVSTYFGLALTKYFVNVVFQRDESPWPNMAEYFGIIAISIVYSIVVLVGFIFFIIPGIWLGMLFAFSVPVFLYEKKGVFASMKRSMELVQNRWWASFIRLVLPNLLWQIGVSFVVYGSFIVFGAFAAIWFGIGASAEASGSIELIHLLNIFGGFMGIAAVIGLIVLHIGAYLAAGIAQISIMLETYKSLEHTYEK